MTIPTVARRATDARQAYRYAFLGLAFVTLVLASILASLAIAHRSDARFVDESGLERMRSQRIAFLALRSRAPANADLASDRAELRLTLTDFRATASLLAGDADPRLTRDIAHYADLAEAVLENGPQRTLALTRLLDRRLALLDDLDLAARARAARNAAFVDRFVVAIVVLTIALFVAAAATWTFLIVPYERRERQGAARLRAIFENNPEAIVTYDLQGRIARGNAAAVRLVGHAPGALVGMHLSGHIASDALAPARDAFARTIAGEATEIETVFVRADGERRTVRYNLFPNVVHGTTVGVYAIARDVSALKDALDALRESEQRFRSLYEQNPDSVAIIDSAGAYLSVNAATEELTGRDAASFVGKSLGSLGLALPGSLRLPPDAIDDLRDGRAISYEMQIHDVAGEPVELSGRAVPIVYDGRVNGFFAISRDVTAERRARSVIVESAKRISELYLVAASNGRSSDEQIASALELGRARLGYERAYLVRVRDDLATVRTTVGTDVLAIGTTLPLGQTMLRHSLASGTLHVVEDTEAEPWRSDPAMAVQTVRSSATIPIVVDGRVDGALAFASDLPRVAPHTQSDLDFVRLIAALVGSTIERARQREKLDALAFFDPLTGLPNRVLLDERLGDLILASRGSERRFAVLFVDLDGFKGVNDAGGHGAGDDVLRSVAERLTRIAGPNDTVARLGGDEFVIVMPEARSRADASALAARAIAALAEPFRRYDRAHSIGASIGIAFYPDHGTSAQALLERADRALYRAKRDGRGSFAIHTDLVAQRSAT